MPELPEVETTRKGLQKEAVGYTILDVWTDLKTGDKRKKGTVADIKYFQTFKKEVTGQKIISAERRAKNILINLSNKKTILVHMKMTGYLYVGKESSPTQKFTHLILYLDKNKFLALSDMRKFAKITLLSTAEAHNSKHLEGIGPEPLDKNFNLKKFTERLKKKPNGKIKQVLMDQSVLAGVGNIYSDEILWASGIHPERRVAKISEKEFEGLFKNTKILLRKGINFGGDSMSDYRNIYGLPGKFQLHHNAYRRTGEKCRKPGCCGVIKRIKFGNRSAHFCSAHQT